MKKKSMDQLERKSIDSYKLIKKIPAIVVLDNVRSMANVGAIFRICDAFLIEKIILCGITSSPPHREIHKTALGAEDSVEWEYVSSIEDKLKYFHSQNKEIIAVEQIFGSTPLNSISFSPKNQYVIIFGNEVNGISDNILEYCDNAIEISQYGTKHSLNVANCAAIVIWEINKAFPFK